MGPTPEDFAFASEFFRSAAKLPVLAEIQRFVAESSAGAPMFA
jgi:hypothetical protein